MRTVVMLAVLTTLALATLPPAAEAVGTCTALDPRCPGLACVGTSSNNYQYYYRCDKQIGDRPDPPCHPCPLPW